MTFHFGAVEREKNDSIDSGLSNSTADTNQKVFTCNICQVKTFAMQVSLFQHQKDRHHDTHMQRLNALLYDLYDDQVCICLLQLQLFNMLKSSSMSSDDEFQSALEISESRHILQRRRPFKCSFWFRMQNFRARDFVIFFIHSRWLTSPTCWCCLGMKILNCMIANELFIWKWHFAIT